MKTKIVYEDRDIIVCHKPAGLATQSARPMSPDVESELKNYLRGGELHVIHRLDQPVEGLLVFAKNQKTAADLSAQVNDGRMEKIYHALVCGQTEPECAELTDYLIKTKNGLGQVVSEQQKKQPQYRDAKQAVLSYRVLQQFCDTGVTKLEIRLKTGRFHQIRLQMSHAGYPLVGDAKYGGERAVGKAAELGLHYVALAACRLAFLHPVTQKEMRFEIVPEFEQKTEIANESQA